MAKRKGLGRGLDALLGSSTATDNPAEALRAASDVVADPKGQASESSLRELPIEYMRRGKYQPRRDMHPEALEELAESIKSQGVMQPIVVRGIGENQYEIIAGERRWRACQMAGLDTIPVIIKNVPDEAAIAMALIENIQREDLNPMEEAFALKRLQDEFELTQQEVADAVGKSRTGVTNILRLLNLSDDVKTMLEHGDLEMGHARCLLSLDRETQKSVARQIISKALSVRQAESLVRKLNTEKQKSPSGNPPQASADIKHLEEKLGEHVGVPVMVQHNAKGKGKLVFKYSNLDELDGILTHLQFKQ